LPGRPSTIKRNKKKTHGAGTIRLAIEEVESFHKWLAIRKVIGPKFVIQMRGLFQSSNPGGSDRKDAGPKNLSSPERNSSCSLKSHACQLADRKNVIALDRDFFTQNRHARWEHWLVLSETR